MKNSSPLHGHPSSIKKKVAAVLFKIQNAIETQEKIINTLQELKKSTMEYLFTHGTKREKTKQTKIGQIPESWEVAPIDKQYIFTKKPRDLDYNNYKEIAFVPMDLIPNNSVYSKNYILKKPTEISSGIYFEQGDVLVSKITPCFENGKQCIIDELPNDFGIATTEIIPIKAIRNKSNQHFIFYYLLKPGIRNYIAGKMEGATGRQRVPVNFLKQFLIPFLSFNEQREISKILLKIDSKMSIHSRIIVNLQDLFNSMLNKLMTGEIRVNDLDIDVSEVE